MRREIKFCLIKSRGLTNSVFSHLKTHNFSISQKVTKSKTWSWLFTVKYLLSVNVNTHVDWITRSTRRYVILLQTINSSTHALISSTSEDMTRRLTALADGARENADMNVILSKTFSQHVHKRTKAQVTVTATAVQKPKRWRSNTSSNVIFVREGSRQIRICRYTDATVSITTTLRKKCFLMMTMSRCDKLLHIFDSPHISVQVNLRLYEAAICSLLTYGCETWDLDSSTLKRINGANSVMLARITGQSIPVEAQPQTTSFNLIKKIRERRLRWLGHIIRAGPDSICTKPWWCSTQWVAQVIC